MPDGAVVQVHGYVDFCVVTGCVPDVVRPLLRARRRTDAITGRRTPVSATVRGRAAAG